MGESRGLSEARLSQREKIKIKGQIKENKVSAWLQRGNKAM